jgi:hypothetical protein
MTKRIKSACRDCKRCTNSDVANIGRGAGRAGAAVLTVGMSSMVKSMRKKCRVCDHPLHLHSER